MVAHLCAHSEHSVQKRLGPAVNCISHPALIAATLTSSFRHCPPLQLQKKKKCFPLPVTIRRQSCNFSEHRGGRASAPFPQCVLTSEVKRATLNLCVCVASPCHDSSFLVHLVKAAEAVPGAVPKASDRIQCVFLPVSCLAARRRGSKRSSACRLSAVR